MFPTPESVSLCSKVFGDPLHCITFSAHLPHFSMALFCFCFFYSIADRLPWKPEGRLPPACVFGNNKKERDLEEKGFGLSHRARGEVLRINLTPAAARAASELFTAAPAFGKTLPRVNEVLKDRIGLI